MSKRSMFVPGRFPSESPVPEVPPAASLDPPPSPHPVDGSRAAPIDLTGIPAPRMRPFPKGSQRRSRSFQTQKDSGRPIHGDDHEEPAGSSSRPRKKPRVASNPEFNRPSNPMADSPRSIPKTPPPTPSTPKSGNSKTSFPEAKVLTPQALHEKVRTFIRSNFTPSKEKGIVYVLRNPQWPNILKIGNSKNLEQRTKNIKSKCGLILEVVHISPEVYNRVRVEKLAQKDLLHLKRPYTCPKCFGSHDEWFEVSDEMAKATVDRWATFLQSDPYCLRGQLKGIWDHLLTERSNLLQKCLDIDHEARWKHWDSVLCAPNTFDHVKYALYCTRSHPIWPALWQFSWQFSTVMSLTIIFVVVRNSLTFGVLVLYVGCTCVSISSCGKVIYRKSRLTSV